MGLYDPVLTSAGVLSGGKLSDSAKQKFWSSVADTMAQGNGSLGGDLLKFPAVSGGLTADQLSDRDRFPTLHSIFLDTLYEKMANGLDLSGNTPLAATGVFDVTALPIPPDVKLPSPIPLFPPDFTLLAKLLGIPDPLPPLPQLTVQVSALLPKIGIKIPPPLPKLPEIPTFPSLGIVIPPLPDPPDIPIPEIPSLPSLIVPPLPGLPPLVLPDFSIDFYVLPFKLLLEILATDPIKLITDLIPKLPGSLIDILLDKALSILKSLNLVAPPLPDPPPPPTLLLSCVITLVKNMASMVSSAIICQIVGTGTIATGPSLSLR